jgi:TolB-like protein
MKKWCVLFAILFLVPACSSTGKPTKVEGVTAEKISSPTKTAAPVDREDAATILVNTVVEHIHKLPNKRLTVTEFTDIDGGESEIGKLLSEKVTTKLSQVSEIRVIERKQLNKIIEEQKLSLSDITEEDEKEVGRILNVDAIVSGSVAHLDDFIEINARMIDVTTGEIYCAINHREKFDLKKKDLARLPEPQRIRINQAVQKREVERKRNPEAFYLQQKLKKQLLKIKRKDPESYRRAVKSIRRMERIKKQNPRFFLLTTEPRNSPKLRKVKSQKPQLFTKVKQTRIQLGATIKQVPAYREILRRQRLELIGKKLKRSK